jgi:CHASE2 domain-containing sensor protein
VTQFADSASTDCLAVLKDPDEGGELVQVRVGSLAAWGSYVTTSEGGQNILCAYLSLAVLVGLGASALVGWWWWADPIVALAVALVVIQVGAKTWRGEQC